jgi:hypothetical protein
MRPCLLALPVLAAATAAHADSSPTAATTPSTLLSPANTVVLANEATTMAPSLTLDPFARAGNTGVGPKSPEMAAGLALLGTVTGPVLIYASFRSDGPGSTTTVPLVVAGVTTSVLGPSLGNWYAGEALSAGLGVRVLGAGVVAGGMGMFVHNLFSNDSAAGIGLTVALAGTGIVGIGAVMDIAHAPAAARAYNRSHAARSLAIAPLVANTSSGRETGLAVAGTF